MTPVAGKSFLKCIKGAYVVSSVQHPFTIAALGVLQFCRSVSQLASNQLWVDTASRAERMMVAEGCPAFLAKLGWGVDGNLGEGRSTRKNIKPSKQFMQTVRINFSALFLLLFLQYHF